MLPSDMGGGSSLWDVSSFLLSMWIPMKLAFCSSPSYSYIYSLLSGEPEEFSKLTGPYALNNYYYITCVLSDLLIELSDSAGIENSWACT